MVPKTVVPKAFAPKPVAPKGFVPKPAAPKGFAPKPAAPAPKGFAPKGAAPAPKPAAPAPKGFAPKGAVAAPKPAAPKGFAPKGAVAAPKGAVAAPKPAAPKGVAVPKVARPTLSIQPVKAAGTPKLPVRVLPSIAPPTIADWSRVTRDDFIKLVKDRLATSGIGNFETLAITAAVVGKIEEVIIELFNKYCSLRFAGMNFAIRLRKGSVKKRRTSTTVCHTPTDSFQGPGYEVVARQKIHPENIFRIRGYAFETDPNGDAGEPLMDNGKQYMVVDGNPEKWFYIDPEFEGNEELFDEMYRQMAERGETIASVEEEVTEEE